MLLKWYAMTVEETVELIASVFTILNPNLLIDVLIDTGVVMVNDGSTITTIEVWQSTEGEV